jgi:hypothetical protein
MGNGVLTFDVSDDQQFKTFVVEKLGILTERTEGLKQIKVDVPLLKQEVADIRDDMKSDKFWTNVKSYSGIVGVALHVAAHKLGFKL